MNKKDEEIQHKLLELEATVLKETPPATALPAANVNAQRLSTSGTLSSGTSQESSTTVQQDLCYFLGIGLIITGVLMFFNHVHVGTGFLAAFGLGGGGFGLILIPLMCCLGYLMYDSKNKIAWAATSIVCGLIIFSVLSSLVMTFPGMTLLGMIMLLLPFAAGGALLLKGIGGPKGIQNKLTAKE